MTGRELKEFAASVPDDGIVELELGALNEMFKEVFDRYRYRMSEFIEWVPLPMAPLRMVITPPMVQAARVKERLERAGEGAS